MIPSLSTTRLRLRPFREADLDGRDALGLTELISLIRPDNARSIALAQRLGATAAETIEFMDQPCLLYRHPA